MRKHLSYALYVSVIFVAMFTSCQKNGSSTDTSKKRLTLEEAKSYYQRLVSKYGNYDLVKVGDTTVKSFKKVDFSKAYVGENETTFFVEAPIAYTKREVELKVGSAIPEATLQEMLKHSFDRLVIYKDKISGMVNEKIVTVIPSADYVTSGLKDLYNNHYQSPVEAFSGYVSNKNWKGHFQSSQSYHQGKAITVSTPPIAAKAANTSSCVIQQQYRALYECWGFTPEGIGQYCIYRIEPYEVLVCDPNPPPAHTHPAVFPGPDDPYWWGWPDPQNIPGANGCPAWPRYYESPITYAYIGFDGGNTFTVSFEGGCFCFGYSFLILEDVVTGTEYSFPIENQNFILPNCTVLWESNLQLPAYVPNGTYYVKVWQDGDVFYHQWERNGLVERYFWHTLTR